MLKTQIVGACGQKYSVDVADGTGERHALVVATRPLKVFENSVRFFEHDDYGADMNVNISFGGTAEKVHNGIDDVLWTASDIVGGGKTTFNNGERSYPDNDEQSIKVDNSPTGDIYQLAKGSDLDCTGYVALSMWINVDKDWKNNDVVELYGWDTGTGLQVGDSVDLSDYFEFNSYDNWQKIVIPLIDMGDLASYTTLDALRIKQTAKDGPKAPKYWLDDIQFEQTGTPATFTLEPDKGTWLHVNEFQVSMVDALASTLGDGTMPNLAYDKFLGVTPVAGITYQRIQGQEPQFTQTISNLMGFLQLAGTDMNVRNSDGTNTWVTIRVKHQEPLILKAEDADKLQWTVSEDLSGLLHLRINAGCSIETRE